MIEKYEIYCGPYKNNATSNKIQNIHFKLTPSALSAHSVTFSIVLQLLNSIFKL